MSRFGRLVATIVAVCMLIAVPTLTACSSPETVTAHNGEFWRGSDRVVLRGINITHVWNPDQTLRSLADIKQFGANSARIVLSTGHRWKRTDSAEVGAIVRKCRDLGLFCVLEVHDTTGWGEQPDAASLDEAIDYWVSMRKELVGTENFIAINIGNEPFGNNLAANESFVSTTRHAIVRMRAEGFSHLLVIDGPNWGQDWQFILRDHAREIVDADPLHNTNVSIHMYGSFATAELIRSYFDALTAQKVPFMVGEFGTSHESVGPDAPVLLAEANRRGIGYFGWSWSGNSPDLAYLDIVSNFDPRRLTAWGRQLRDAIRESRPAGTEGTTQ